MKIPSWRTLLIGAHVFATLVLAGCGATLQPSDYTAEQPKLDLKSYFNGTVDAWGIFQDRSGKVIKRFTVVMDCRWEGDTGNSFNWRYTLALPVDGSTYHVSFDDWMFMMDDKVMLNRAVMSKFGFRLGEITLSFRKREP